MAVITVENLKYRYPHTERLALSGLSFSVEKGEFIGVIGENGAGKSTLAQALIGLVPQFHKGAYGGSVTAAGLQAQTTPVAQMCEKVGLVFQNPFNQLSGAKDTVYEEVAFGMQNLGVERQEMKHRTEETLRRLGIWQYRDRNPFDLSGGQMQRVAIASVLVMQPQILILDEPTSQLDPQGSEEVFRAVGELSRSGITILMIEQKIEKLAAHCDRILLLHQGRQIAFDTPRKIFSMEGLEEKYGVQPPAFTRICRRLDRRLPDHTYPVTRKEAEGLFAERKQKTGSGAAAAEKQERRESHSAQEQEKETAERLPDRANILKQAQNSAAQQPGKTDAQDAQKEAPVFEIQNLCFSYHPQTPVLEGLHLILDRRPTAVIGQNGAGKTTLVKLLKGLLRPVSGQILFYGEDIAGKTVAMLAGEVGYVFQNPDDQIFKYNVLDEVMFGPLNIGMTREKAETEAKKALELVGLSGRETENPYDLELHERKLVAIASVLAMNTQVLILDEPTIAQDCRGRRIIGGIIRRLSQEGRLVLAILHDMDFVAEYFERVIVMAHGQVLADANAAEAFSQKAALAEAALERPYAAQLGERLGLSHTVLTVEELADCLR
ncbi:MAG: ABC transporter ATP-binding protein [Eubacteriales bacterium]|nr:ABC transporter ATP-binding protein [Eubacteriales bacterium]